MKLVVLPLMMIMFASCAADIIKVEFSMSTQMGRTLLAVDADSVIVTFNGRSEPTRYSRAVEDIEWTNVITSLKDVDFNAVATLESPTNKRQVDASPSSSFIFTTKDSSYKSAYFDGHNPHEMLKPLMEAITAIEENNKD